MPAGSVRRRGRHAGREISNENGCSLTGNPAWHRGHPAESAAHGSPAQWEICNRSLLMPLCLNIVADHRRQRQCVICRRLSSSYWACYQWFTPVQGATWFLVPGRFLRCGGKRRPEQQPVGQEGDLAAPSVQRGAFPCLPERRRLSQHVPAMARIKVSASLIGDEPNHHLNKSAEPSLVACRPGPRAISLRAAEGPGAVARVGVPAELLPPPSRIENVRLRGAPSRTSEAVAGTGRTYRMPGLVEFCTPAAEYFTCL